MSSAYKKYMQCDTPNPLPLQSHDKWWVGLRTKHGASGPMAAAECLIAVRHTSRAGGSNVSRSSSSTDVRPLSASGFFLRSFIISSASWLASLVDIKLDSSARPGAGAGAGDGAAITWSWKVQPHPEFVILYQVLHVHIASLVEGGCYRY